MSLHDISATTIDGETQSLGEYKGKHHEVKRSTPGAAAKGWADAAKYHSN